MPGCLANGSKYEDLISDKIGELSRLANFLDLEVKREDLVKILNKYEPEKTGI